MPNPQVLYRGATEYVAGSVTADVDLSGITAPDFSFDGTTWTAASWSAAAVDNGDGTWTRTARLLVVVSTTFTTAGPRTVLCRISAAPEVPIFSLGSVDVR
ncbi:MAG TPA: hypothetical protein VJ782_01880 [Aeromicrobium sp.]|nr:hypothetical protein [Aeromicrobium sp.]